MRCRASIVPLLLTMLVVVSFVPMLARAQVQSEGRLDLSNVEIFENDCSWLNTDFMDFVGLLGPVSCGTLEVPENWLLPGERQLNLSYVVLHSTGDTPAADPVVYLEGGPGGSALIGLPYYAALFATFREHRDVVLYDQRGTGRSSPLQCGTWTIDELFSIDLSDDADGPEEEAIASDAADQSDAEGSGEPAAQFAAPIVTASGLLTQARASSSPEVAHCAQELFADGVDLRQYNSNASAHDLVALMRMLGYETFNFYGISYGTRLALVTMREFPDSGIRSVVLDSTYPPGIEGFELYPAEPHEVVFQLFADCYLDPVCNEAYPNLKQRFVQLLARLEHEPIAVEGDVTITADDLIDVMQSISSMVQVAPYIPRMIDELEQGKADTYLGIVSGQLFAATVTDEPAATPVGEEPAATPVAMGAPEAVNGSDETDPELAYFLATIGAANATGALTRAQTFLLRVLKTVSALPEGQANELIARLILVGKLPDTRNSLRQFVDRAFADPGLEAVREALQEDLARLSDDDVRDVFVYLTAELQRIDPASASLNPFTFNSVECNESVPFQRFEQTVETAMALEIPELGTNTLPGIAAQFVACEDWLSGRAPEIANRPVSSDIPTLILAGTYDLQTPLSWNKEAFVHLPNAGLLIFPMSGHGVITFSLCASDITAEFVQDPLVYPDSTCIADLYPDWALPAGP